MTQEEKKLLLIDFCARLPYGVKVRGVFLNYNKDKDKILYEECDKELNLQDLKRYESLKPYLRPMSSMTEEEKKEYAMFFRAFSCSMYERESVERIDWLHAHHFDYRELIPMGLAIEAPEDMYKFIKN